MKRTASVINVYSSGIKYMYEIRTIEDLNGDMLDCISVGEVGRGRRLFLIPIYNFDKTGEGVREINTRYFFVNRKEPIVGTYTFNNKTPLFTVETVDHPQDTIIIFSLGGGYRGSAEYEVISGKLEYLGSGISAQGDAGRMGKWEVPVFINRDNGPFTVRWKKYGRTYSEEPIHYIVRNKEGGNVVVLPESRYNLVTNIPNRQGAADVSEYDNHSLCVL